MGSSAFFQKIGQQGEIPISAAQVGRIGRLACLVNASMMNHHQQFKLWALNEVIPGLVPSFQWFQFGKQTVIN